MSEPTLSQWKARALKAEKEVELITRMRNLDKEQELKMARKLAQALAFAKVLRDAADTVIYTDSDQE